MKYALFLLALPLHAGSIWNYTGLPFTDGQLTGNLQISIALDLPADSPMTIYRPATWSFLAGGFVISAPGYPDAWATVELATVNGAISDWYVSYQDDWNLFSTSPAGDCVAFQHGGDLACRGADSYRATILHGDNAAGGVWVDPPGAVAAPEPETWALAALGLLIVVAGVAIIEVVVQEGEVSEVVKAGDLSCVHDWQEFIDPNSGGWMRCRICGRTLDCEDPDGDLG